MSYESVRLYIHVADIEANVDAIRDTLHKDAKTKLVDSDEVALNDGLIANTATGMINGEDLSLIHI